MNNRISESEKRVMEALWDKSPQSSLEITQQLEEQSWSEKTVRTFLNRLIKKEIVSFEKEGRRYLYYPLIERKAFLEEQSQGFLANIFKGDIKELLATFVHSKQLSDEEVRYLKKLLKDEKSSK